MSKFVIGDRVHVYGIGNISPKDSCTVKDVEADYLEVLAPHGISYWTRVHPKQCRKIKAKKPLRSFWVNYYGQSEGAWVTYFSKEAADSDAGIARIECVEFVEVRKKTS